MKVVAWMRVVLALFVAVLMPLELGHCAFMPLQSAALAHAAIEHHSDADDDCCSEDGAPHQSASQSNDCCCGNIHLPAVTVSASVSAPPPPAPLQFAVPATMSTGAVALLTFVGLEPATRSGSPPDPSTAPESPRSPPHSA